eukprot:TRINITY_DN6385_c0_g1_i2.p1 TRINITY_DN6385_c0_g1~~TRINITY_DN6385_c0_g1_i2.p1  ORF type:complete len:875 (+),score=192.87 TRINITY_DN6385_c0_g1_i2:571-3195(+)
MLRLGGKTMQSFLVRAAVLLVGLFALYFVMHSKLEALPGSNADLHHLTGGEKEHDRPHVAGTNHEEVTKARGASANSDLQHADAPTEISAPLGKGRVRVVHYGHGILHVQYEATDGPHTHENGRHVCRHHEHVVTSSPVPFTEVAQSDAHGISASADSILFEAKSVSGGIDISVGHNVHMRFSDQGDKVTVVQPTAKAATGFAERTSGLLLKTGKYELWNLDVQYTLNNNDPIYGVVPMVVGIGATRGDSSGVLSLNPGHTVVDMTVGDTVQSVWKTKRGCAQFVVYPGGSTLDVLRQHAHTTGRPFFPPLFSLGYHQCRWSYKTQKEVEELNYKFVEHDMPCDAVWLDIDHAKEKNYFEFEKRTFPDPKGMLSKLQENGRKLITINDPHVHAKHDYFVFDQGEKHSYFVKNARGTGTFHGHCWPGDSAWYDFLNPKTRNFYADLFAFSTYKDSSPRVFTWIDMNEPSVFSGPRITLPDGVQHYDGTPHVEVHNIYGHLHAMAAFEGHHRRSQGQERGFILTRSFFAGTQRYAAVWTGDNKAQWEYLSASIHMLLALSMGGIPFVGADVGGFFAQHSGGTTDHDLMSRWFQVGSMYPFFRGHAHEQSVRKEPYLVDDTYRSAVRHAMIRRYSLLPYLYTAFWNASTEGVPVWRPLFLHFPEERPTRVGAFMVGDSLLFAPVVSKSMREFMLKLPGDSGISWFEYETHERHSGGSNVPVTVDIQTNPLYQISGSVVVTKLVTPRVTSTESLSSVGYELRIAVDKDGYAEGFLYLDDGHSNDYLKGHYNFKKVVLEAGVLKIVCGHGDITSPYSRMPPHDVPYTPKEANIVAILLLGWQSQLAERLSTKRLSNDAIRITGVDFTITGGWELQLTEN